MKALFFTAVLLGAIYLVIETEQGQQWIDEYLPSEAKQTVTDVAGTATNVVEGQVTNLIAQINAEQKARIQELELRIEMLEEQLSNHQSELPSTTDVEEEASEIAQINKTLANQPAAMDDFSKPVKTLQSDQEKSRLRAVQLREISDSMNALALSSLTDL